MGHPEHAKNCYRKLLILGMAFIHGVETEEGNRAEIFQAILALNTKDDNIAAGRKKDSK